MPTWNLKECWIRLLPVFILIPLLLGIVDALNSTGGNSSLMTENLTVNETTSSTTTSSTSSSTTSSISTTSLYTTPSPKLAAGSLKASLIDPNGDADVIQNKFFNFTSKVECIGGYCGNITATLDPTKSRRISGREHPTMLETDDGFTLKYVFKDPVIERGEEFDSVTIPGTYRYGPPGYPVLPFKTARVLIPHGEKIIGIEVIPGQEKVIGKGFRIEPGQKPVILCSGDAAEFTPPDEKIYSSHNEFPEGLFSKDYRIQEKRGYSILIVNLFPVRYIPATGRLSYFRDLTLTIKTRREKRVERPGNFRGLPGDRKVLEGIADNPPTLKTYDGIGKTRLGGSHRTSFVNPSESYDYVIITSAALNASSGAYTFHDLVDHKNSRGVKSRIVTVEQIMAEDDYDCDGAFGDSCVIPEFNDTAAHIRNFIKDAYANWGIQYVLLGGDGDGADVGGESGDNIIPARGFYVYIENQWTEEYNLISDLYYAGLDGTWNNDNDSYWGEEGEDDIPAEVYVGRAPVDSDSEVSNFVMKTIAYENSNDAYLEKALMVGEDLGPDMQDAKKYKEEIRNGSSAYGYNTTGFPDNYNVSTLYDEDGIWSKSQLIFWMNNGTHIINHLGHSNVDYAMKMYNSDVDALTNDRYFFAYSQGCYPGAFDNRGSSGSYYSYDSIGEHFVTEPHGAFAVVMNSRYGWGTYDPDTNGPSQYLDREFFDALFGEDKRHLGEANHDSKEDNIGFMSGLPSCSGADWPCGEVIRWVIYETNLLGDPETSIKIPGEGKGIIPVNESDAKPFYTISSNPYDKSSISCLANMDAGDSCNQTWIVNATGDSDSWEFFVTYESDNPSVNANISKKINVTIIDKTSPLISDVRNTSITYHSAKITWKTDDYANSTVYYGTTPSGLSLVNWSTSFEKSHEITIENMSSFTVYYYNVSSCNVDGHCSESGPYSFRTKPMLIEINEFGCHNSIGWTDCANIGYGDKLTQVRVNCTSKDGSVVDATFTLENVPDLNIFFTGNATKSDGYWVYNNADLLINDSGLWNLSVVCKDNITQENRGSEIWTVPWGHLEPYLIDPTSDKEVIQDKFFKFSSGVRCVEGECGNVSATLDPSDRERLDRLNSLELEDISNETADKRINAGKAGEIISSFEFPSPIGLGWGLAYDGSELWVSDVEDYPYTGKDCEVTTTGIWTGVGFNITPYMTHFGADLAWDGTYLWQVMVDGLGADDIYQLDTSGNVISSFDGPSGVSERGITYDGEDLWIGGWNSDTIYHVTTEGAVIDSFPFADVAGLAWDDTCPGGPYLWVSRRDAQNTIYQVNPSNGSIISFFYAPGIEYGGAGLAFDGSYLWWTSKYNNTVYQLYPGMDCKGVIPMNNGTPFYTIDHNPYNSSNKDCLKDMKPGDSCNQTWRVNATGDVNTSMNFFTIYSAMTYASYIPDNKTSIINITIVSEIQLSLTYSITPKVVINGSNVTIGMNASDPYLDRMWCVITRPDSSKVTLDLDPSPVSYNPPSTGRYSITFYANDSAGNENSVDDHFIVRPGLLFNSSIVDYNGSGLDTNMSFYYNGSLILSNESDDGNFSLWVPDYVYDLEFSTFNGSLVALLKEVNLSRNNNKTINFDQTRISGYLVTYAVESNYTFTGAVLTLSYDNTGYGNENYLGVYKCSNWNLPARKCSGSWQKVVSGVTQDTAENLLRIETDSFSAYGVKQLCSDGTEHGKCSTNKPKYCNNGTLVDKCNKCGCPSGKTCNIRTGKCYTPSGGGGSSGGGGRGGGGGFSAIAIAKATCYDGLKNCHDGACEEGIDCGGPCAPCPSCEDGIQNQGEEGVDCGGPCKPCITTTTTVKATTSSIKVTTTTLPALVTTIPETTVTTTIPTGMDHGATISGILLIILTLAIGNAMVHLTMKRKNENDEIDGDLKTIEENVMRMKSGDLSDEEHNKILRDTIALYEDVEKRIDQ